MNMQRSASGVKCSGLPRVSLVCQAQKINKQLPLQFTVIYYRHYVCFCSLDAFKSLHVLTICDVKMVSFAQIHALKI